ncbi:MAG: glutamate mutase L [Armatimonadota bacterium]
MSTDDPQVILATDCGSTTTKAILIEGREQGYRLRVRGEAPTTVEAPFEDVTRGVLNAIAEAEELSGRGLLEGEGIRRPARDGQGTDLYLSTSSAGGGLQMMVSGVVLSMTAESAERAALGAGAIVMDVIASNDRRLPHEKIKRIRQLRPDMILLSGGVDGGTTSHVVELAEIIAAANPRPRLGQKFRLPVIYAGNRDARDAIGERLADKTDLHIVDNLRPVLEQENLQPARREIQDLFLEHVMAQAPGYARLIEWTDAEIMPTPAAVGALIQTVAEEQGINVIGVDIGGATTDVFSVFDGTFNRTVSANRGMSYSISNVLAEAGQEDILRWVPDDMGVGGIGNQIRNKMIRPTSIPQTLSDLVVEQAVAREALRLSFEQHKSLAVGLSGVQQARTISDVFEQTLTGETLVDMMALDLLVGSGGVLSHAPRRQQCALMLIDGFRPEGITRLAVDSIFMMPQLGVLAGVHPQAATEVFERDCLIPLGTCIAPVGQDRPGAKCVRVEMGEQSLEVPYGEMRVIQLPPGRTARARVHPTRRFDVGAGRGDAVERELHGGVVGIIVDARGRPLELSTDPTERTDSLRRWWEALGVYPA